MMTSAPFEGIQRRRTLGGIEGGMMPDENPIAAIAPMRMKISIEDQVDVQLPLEDSPIHQLAPRETPILRAIRTAAHLQCSPPTIEDPLEMLIGTVAVTTMAMTDHAPPLGRRFITTTITTMEPCSTTTPSPMAIIGSPSSCERESLFAAVLASTSASTGICHYSVPFTIANHQR